ncbi:MAG: hypothetical protein HY013_21100 [Candidatus Solibacter usitatus]|nr:hypothetical protein [Candidatus Solibacter usitatus]
MALRSEKRIGALLIVLASAAAAQPLRFQVRHQHWRKGATGELRIDPDTLSFQESGKKKFHSREWKYQDIQQLVLSPDRLSILTYEDNRRQMGRDREFHFDRLPKELAAKAYPLFRGRLDQRFIAALADSELKPLWQIRAKLLHKLGGSEGVLLVGEERIVYSTREGDASRTWRLRDIDNVSSSGPFDLTFTTLERAEWHHGGPREVRFQLKEALSEDRYKQLWRKISFQSHSGEQP